MSPRVSILFPIYNVEPYLREAVDSMLSQTFTDFELICLDDCSPDHSAEILDSYSDPRIVRYRGEKNQGLANVLNVGMDMARGEYIARMDSDDISLPDRLQVQVDYLDNHSDIDLVSVGLQMFGAKNRVLSHPESVEYVKCTALLYSPILHASSMWRKDRFASAKLRFRQEMVPAEDYDMWTRALIAKMQLINLPLILYKYRIHPNQATASIPNIELRQNIVSTYLHNIFPSATSEMVEYLFAIYSATKSYRAWRQYMCVFEEENDKSQFFDAQYLHTFLKRFYQNQLYWRMRQNGVTWQVVQMRPRQIYSLIMSKK